MIHHASFGSNDPARARAFYDAILPVVGLSLMKATDTMLDYGSGKVIFSVETPVDGKPATVGNGSHIAFEAKDRAVVHHFHQAALSHGGTSDGEPGLRPEYDAHHYGAFVRDPDGNKIEVVIFSAD